MKRYFLGLVFSLWTSVACAGVTCSLPYDLLDDNTAYASQVMANYNAIITCLTNAAAAGANDDITALLALTTPIPASAGGSVVYVGGTSGGSANAQTITPLTPTGLALTKGNFAVFVAGFTNTAAMQLNVNGTGLTNFYQQTPSGPIAMTGGEVILNQLVIAVYDGTQWQLVNNGPQKGGFGPLLTIASATTTDLGTVPTHNADITGTTTITSFGQSALTTFPLYKVVFSGALTITYNQTNCSTTGGCILTPGGVNIVTAANDTAELLYLGTGSSGPGNWQVINYQRQSGQSLTAPTPLCGFVGLVSANGASQSTITFSWTQSVLLNSSNTPIYSASENGTINITTSGAGGLDTGSPANNTFYYLYGISNGTLYNGLASLSATSPTLPSGYTYVCRYGAIKTNGSANLYGTKQLGNEAWYVNGGANLATSLPLIVNGVDSSSSCGAAAPSPTSITVYGTSGAGVWFPTGATAADFVLWNGYNNTSPTAETFIAPSSAYTGITGTAVVNPPPLGLPQGTTPATLLGRLKFETAAILYCSTSPGGAVFAYGWKDSVNAN